MHPRLLLVELPEDGGPVLHAARAQAEESGCRARDLPGERQLRARHDADRRIGIFRRREAPCAGSEIACRELVADSRGTRLHVVKAVVAHGEDSFPHSPPWPLELARSKGSAKSKEEWCHAINCARSRRPATRLHHVVERAQSRAW